MQEFLQISQKIEIMPNQLAAFITEFVYSLDMQDF
jgi:hypothetical protein